jgi:hypothetical protein
MIFAVIAAMPTMANATTVRHPAAHASVTTHPASCSHGLKIHHDKHPKG